MVASCVDFVDQFPKLLEIVGLGYTVWFGSRYLLFKVRIFCFRADSLFLAQLRLSGFINMQRNRDELLAKIEELKEEIVGSEDD